MDDLSVGRSVCPVHFGKTADLIRMPFGRKGPGMRQVAGFGDPSTGRGTFGGEFGARHFNQSRLRRTCATFPQPSELPFGMVRAVGRGIAVLDGVHVVQGEGEVLGFCSPFLHWEMPLARRR